MLKEKPEILQRAKKAMEKEKKQRGRNYKELSPDKKKRETSWVKYRPGVGASPGVTTLLNQDQKLKAQEKEIKAKNLQHLMQTTADIKSKMTLKPPMLENNL